MRRILPFGLVLTHLFGVAAGAVEPDYDMVQPVESRSNVILESTKGWARIERLGAAAQRVPLRSDEFLTTIAETRAGWTAAGVREKESSTSLIVMSRGANGTQRLAAPALQRHPLQLRPTLAVRDESLEGMAWLEGPDLTSLSVRVSSRGDGAWAEPTVVGPPARGSQTGLVSAVLSAGDWLLVWSAFDGHDDEIMWSVGRDAEWSVPQLVGKNNSTPDIMPTLVATPAGALLIWSRMIDGHYRLMSANFRSGGWSRPSVLGPPGSLDPSFAIQDGQLLLLYRHAWPSAWAISEVSDGGQLQRLAVQPGESSTRPVLMSSSGESIRLRFPNRRQLTVGWEAVP